MKTYGNASSVSHWINLGMVIIAWANAMMIAILPRFAWMNPETSGQILFQGSTNYRLRILLLYSKLIGVLNGVRNGGPAEFYSPEMERKKPKLV